MTYEEVSTWDVGMKFHPTFPLQKKMPAIKPLLSDVIAAVEDYARVNHLKPLKYNIETKCAPSTDGISHPTPAVFVALLIDVIAKGKISKRTTIQSFDKRTLQVLHQSFPTIKTCLLSYATFNEYTILIYGKLILAKHKFVEISQIIKLASI